MKRKLVFNIYPLKARRQDLRSKATQAEKILWERIRNNKLGHKFFRQYSIEGYVIDFYCPEKRLGIEVEGLIHVRSENKIYDKYRLGYLEAYNIRFMRIANEKIYREISNVVKGIKEVLSSPS